MLCKKPFILKGKYDLYGRAKSVGCGMCMQCRINRTREWQIRIMHEKNYWKYSDFVTLTYDDEKYNVLKGLSKRDAQLFLKRLRKKTGIDIVYYLVGEYGSKTARPHYHAIIMSNFKITQLEYQMCWNRGFIYLGTVTKDSVRYVSGYIQKKLNGEKAKEIYGSLEAPFSLMSKGIGYRYVLDNLDRLMLNPRLMIRGKETDIPRYYVKVLQSLDKEYIDKRIELIKELRLKEKVDEFFGYKVDPGLGRLDDYDLDEASQAKVRDYNNKLKARLFSSEKL